MEWEEFPFYTRPDEAGASLPHPSDPVQQREHKRVALKRIVGGKETEGVFSAKNDRHCHSLYTVGVNFKCLGSVLTISVFVFSSRGLSAMPEGSHSALHQGPMGEGKIILKFIILIVYESID